MTERQSLKNMGDYDNIINTAAEEAHAAGKAEGLKQGKLQANLQSAKNLKALGVPAEIISQGTGLTIDEIEKL